MVKNIVYLTQAQWETLTTTGYITVEGVTHYYDEDNDYRVETDVLTDAPSDNKQYARQNGTWTEVQGGSGTPEIFWCEYGVTTTAEVGAALQAGKIPVCKYQGLIYVCTYYLNFGSYYGLMSFTSLGSGTSRYVLLLNESADWSYSEYEIKGNYNFEISNLSANTTSFTFQANKRCYQKVSIAASATLNFAVENMADNYVRIYNSGSSEITLAIGNVTNNGTAVSAKVGPAEIKCGVGKYVEISVIYDGSDATFTASENLQILN